jgi:predicted O-methyltransferase YrrM
MRLRDSNQHQDIDELKAFVKFAVDLDVRRYLEIGSRNGDSFFAVMANLMPGSFGMSIDLPESIFTMRRMTETVMELRDLNMETALFYGSSRYEAAKAAARAFAPFDLVLIDGDHTLNGVASDWNDYWTFGKAIAVHDVDAPDGWKSSGLPNEVGRFWRELKATLAPGLETREFITPGSKMGYGVVLRP